MHMDLIVHVHAREAFISPKRLRGDSRSHIFTDASFRQRRLLLQHFQSQNRHHYLLVCLSSRSEPLEHLLLS